MRNKAYFSTLLLLALALATYSQSTAKAPENLDYQVPAVLYQQKAAEYRALAYQAFNIARLRLDADLDPKNAKMLPKE